MNSNEVMQAFLARPLSKQGNLEASFFQKVQERLVIPALKKAERDVGFQLKLEVGSEPSSKEMLESILRRIEIAEICMFDITSLNSNVLIEYGYRRSILNTPIAVLACRDETPKLPFDLQHQSVIFYNREDIEGSSIDQHITELAQCVIDALKRYRQKPCLVTTDYIYTCYSRLQPSDELLIWVATWPAFPKSWRETNLINCGAKSIIIAGPVENVSQLPGIFWRLEIKERREQTHKGSFQIYGKSLPVMKMIVAGNESFLAPESSVRTARYYYLGRTSPDHRNLFLDGLQGARPIEEAIYLFFQERLRQHARSILSSDEVMRLFEEEISQNSTSPEAKEYDRKWVFETICKWIPHCISRVKKDRGWTSLDVFQDNKGNFRLRLKPKGKCLEHRHYFYLRGEIRRSFPKLRLIVTNHCELGCSYCPPENEDYAGGTGHNTMTEQEIKLLLEAGYACGFREFSITGGEPLIPHIGQAVVSALSYFLNDPQHKEAKVALQTNGRYLENFLDDIGHLPHLSLKISLDTTSRSITKVAKSMVSAEAVQAAVDARQRGISVGINFVLTRDTVEQLLDVARWAQSTGLYLKIMDLNWYNDLGRRETGIGASTDIPKADIYWKSEYLSPIEVYLSRLQDEFGSLLHATNRGYGIPMPETPVEPNGFFIRLKDSSMGSHYAPQCRHCPFYVDKRRCQEGIYQLWVTPAMLLKLCRHRRDIFKDISEHIERRDAAAVQDVIRAMLEEFYFSSEFYKTSG